MPTKQTKPSANNPTSEFSDTARSFVSLFLVLHLFCVFIALTASVLPSPLQASFLAVIRPYIRVLNFELLYSRFNITYGRADTVYTIQFLRTRMESPEDEDWNSLPDEGSRNGEQHRRYRRLSRQLVRLNFVDMAESEAAAARLAQGVAEHFASTGDIEDGGKLRCWRQFPRSIFPLQPLADETSYEADVIVNSDGTANINKTADAREVAQPRSGRN